MDVRIGAPQELWPSDDHVTMCREFAAASGARITVTDDPLKAVSGVDFIYTDVWVSMGEPVETWGDRIEHAAPLPGQLRADGLGRQPAGEVHALPARVPQLRDQVVGAKIAAQYPHLANGIEVTEDVFESPANIAFEQAENRMHTIKAVLVAALELSTVHHADRDRSRWQRAVAARATDDRGEPAGQHPDGCRVHRRGHPGNEIVVAHGNGPQVGLLALQSAAYHDVAPYPLDVLGAQTEAMIGYVIEQELGNLLPAEQPLATLLTMIEVDRDDPAFGHPTKPIGPVYDRETAERLEAASGWAIAPDGDKFRRVVASPKPKRIFEIRPIRSLRGAGHDRDLRRGRRDPDDV